MFFLYVLATANARAPCPDTTVIAQTATRIKRESFKFMMMERESSCFLLGSQWVYKVMVVHKGAINANVYMPVPLLKSRAPDNTTVH